MHGPRHTGPTSADRRGRGSAWRPSLIYIVAALAVLAAGWAAMAWPSRPTAPAGPVAQATLPVGSGSSPSIALATEASAPVPISAARGLAPTAPSAPAPTMQVSRTRDPNGDLTPDLSDYVNSGERPTMGEVIDRLHRAGVYSGLGAFSPPGTRPPLIGLAVPDDFVLPEGYVRHYQATDDGKRIEPILMFSPDHQFFDAAHQPIAIPSDRVVPPELAPPGLPIRRIVIPPASEPGK
jgi:hypothetical protein